jgi:hypothetical protein
MEKDPIDTLLDQTLQYLKEFKEHQPYIMASSSLLQAKQKPLPKEESKPEPKIFEPITKEFQPPKIKSPPEVSKPLKPPVLDENSSAEVQVNTASSPLRFSLHPPSSPHKDSLHDLRSIMKKVTPSIELATSPPSDAKAKHIKHAWKHQGHIPDVPILVSESLPFLHNVAKAIELHFFPSKVILVKPLEEHDRWEAFLNTPNLKMILALDNTLWNSKRLMSYYQEFPSKNTRYLGKIPLLLLPDPAFYIKDPALKRSLWNLLCQVLKPLQK